MRTAIATAVITLILGANAGLVVYGWRTLEQVQAKLEKVDANRHKINGLKGAMSAVYQELDNQAKAAKSDRQDIKRALDQVAERLGAANGKDLENGSQQLYSQEAH